MTYGNNDCEYHYSAPLQSDKTEFYEFMFDLWFEKHTGNKKYKAEAEKTFKKGGYYKVDLGQDLSLLSVNTL